MTHLYSTTCVNVHKVRLGAQPSEDLGDLSLRIEVRWRRVVRRERKSGPDSTASLSVSRQVSGMKIVTALVFIFLCSGCTAQDVKSTKGPEKSEFVTIINVVTSVNEADPVTEPSTLSTGQVTGHVTTEASASSLDTRQGTTDPTTTTTTEIPPTGKDSSQTESTSTSSETTTEQPPLTTTGGAAEPSASTGGATFQSTPGDASSSATTVTGSATEPSTANHETTSIENKSTTLLDEVTSAPESGSGTEVQTTTQEPASPSQESRTTTEAEITTFILDTTPLGETTTSNVALSSTEEATMTTALVQDISTSSSSSSSSEGSSTVQEILIPTDSTSESSTTSNSQASTASTNFTEASPEITTKQGVSSESSSSGADVFPTTQTSTTVATEKASTTTEVTSTLTNDQKNGSVDDVTPEASDAVTATLRPDADDVNLFTTVSKTTLVTANDNVVSDNDLSNGRTTTSEVGSKGTTSSPDASSDASTAAVEVTTILAAVTSEREVSLATTSSTQVAFEDTTLQETSSTVNAPAETTSSAPSTPETTQQVSSETSESLGTTMTQLSTSSEMSSSEVTVTAFEVTSTATTAVNPDLSSTTIAINPDVSTTTVVNPDTTTAINPDVSTTTTTANPDLSTSSGTVLESRSITIGETAPAVPPTPVVRNPRKLGAQDETELHEEPQQVSREPEQSLSGKEPGDAPPSEEPQPDVNPPQGSSGQCPDCEETQQEDPLCGDDGHVYASDCILQKMNCLSDKNVSSGDWEKCRGAHYLCPAECLQIYDPVCAGPEFRIYRNLCHLRKRNCGKRMDIMDLSVCYARAKESRSFTPCPRDCAEVHRPVCGSDGNIYGNECILRQRTCGQGVQVAPPRRCGLSREGSCPEFCLPLPDPVCGSDGRLYLNRCRFRLETCGQNVRRMPRRFCERRPPTA